MAVFLCLSEAVQSYCKAFNSIVEISFTCAYPRGPELF